MIYIIRYSVKKNGKNRVLELATGAAAFFLLPKGGPRFTVVALMPGLAKELLIRFKVQIIQV